MHLELPDKATPALHLVRHGQSTWNVDRRVQGQTDHPGLTALGREQAGAVARLLVGTNAVRLLTSDLVRAIQTADIIGAAMGLRPTATSLLREQAFGWLEGLDTEVAAGHWEQARQETFDHRGEPVPLVDVVFTGGESMRDVLARAQALSASPLITEASGDVIVVSHGDTIRILLLHLLSADLADPPWREIGNAEVHSVYRNSVGQVVHVRSQSPMFSASSSQPSQLS